MPSWMRPSMQMMEVSLRGFPINSPLLVWNGAEHARIFQDLREAFLDPTERRIRVALFAGRPETDGTYRIIYNKPLEFPPGATAAESPSAAGMCSNLPSLNNPNAGFGLQTLALPSGGIKVAAIRFYANVAKRFDKATGETEKRILCRLTAHIPRERQGQGRALEWENSWS